MSFARCDIVHRCYHCHIVYSMLVKFSVKQGFQPTLAKGDLRLVLSHNADQFSKTFLLSVPIKGQMLHCIAMNKYGHPRTCDIRNAGKTLNTDRSDVLEFFTLEDKQQIMPNNMETQHKHTYS